MHTSFSDKHFSFSFFNESVFPKAVDGKGASQITLKAFHLEESLHRSVLLAEHFQRREDELRLLPFISPKITCGQEHSLVKPPTMKISQL